MRSRAIRTSFAFSATHLHPLRISSNRLMAISSHQSPARFASADFSRGAFAWARDTGLRMKLIYIAGPYRAATEWQVVQNIRRAEALALAVWQSGAACICPHKNT